MSGRIVRAIFVICLMLPVFAYVGASKANDDGVALGRSRVILRSGTDGTVVWKLGRYETDEHPSCTDLAFSGPAGGQYGSFGGCGAPDTAEFSAESGGVRAGDVGAFYGGSFGTVPPGTARVRAGLSDGSSVTDVPVGGYWMIVWKTDAKLERVQALSASGRVLAHA